MTDHKVGASGAERLDGTGGRRLTVPGVGLVEIIGPTSELEQDENVWQVRALEPLSPAQEERLALWLQNEWPTSR